MDKVILGNTGIEVTKLCFGALPLGPLQKKLSVEEGGEIIAYALNSGINFIDTAQIYGTYDHIKYALKKVKSRPIIATKSAATTYKDMEKAILEALEALGLEKIDIFLLHAARAGANVFDLRKGALECLVDYKKKGIIKAIGISTHNVKAAEVAATKDDIDIVFPIINKIGRGILDGNVQDMENAISLCNKNKKGLYLMKVLGGGTMINEYNSCLEYAMNLEGNFAIAIGMVSKEEVDYNVKYFNGERDLEGIITIMNNKIVKVSQNLCASCGKCIEVCHSDAIDFDETEKAYIDPTKCIQCGYCISACPQFCIRVV